MMSGKYLFQFIENDFKYNNITITVVRSLRE